MNDSAKSVTQLLLDRNRGNQPALDELLPLVYEELRRLADHYCVASAKTTPCKRRRWFTKHTCGWWI